MKTVWFPLSLLFHDRCCILLTGEILNLKTCDLTGKGTECRTNLFRAASISVATSFLLQGNKFRTRFQLNQLLLHRQSRWFKWKNETEIKLCNGKSFSYQIESVSFFSFFTAAAAVVSLHNQNCSRFSEI